MNEGTKNTGLERAAQPQELPAALATFQKSIAPKIRFLVGATDDQLVAALTRFCAIPAIRANFLRQNPHYNLQVTFGGVFGTFAIAQVEARGGASNLTRKAQEVL